MNYCFLTKRRKLMSLAFLFLKVNFVETGADYPNFMFKTDKQAGPRERTL